MRGDITYHVYGVHAGRDEDTYLGAFRTVSDAEAEVERLKAREMKGRNWAEQHHNKGFVIREVVVETDFEVPSRPAPRDKYFVKTSAKRRAPGTWEETFVDVFRRDGSLGEAEGIYRYERNYGMLHTFEPFRQGTRELALISPDYTRTAVLDLISGEVIAEEVGSKGSGFCPVGFYVPDWWDVHNESAIPGAKYWTADAEWPVGDFGFVWGCHWGDDTSWKVQYLDLSRVKQGVITRDDRFGYVELATRGFRSPCIDPEVPQNGKSPPFILVSKYQGIAKVTFAVEMDFDLASGASEQWQRLRIGNLE